MLTINIMKINCKAVFFVLTAVVFTVASLAITPQDAWANRSFFKKLDGYWNGKGSIVFSGGQQETLKCRATYFPSEGGRKLRQNIRCASPSYKITASSEYQTKKGQVTGTWAETGFELTGDVTGRVKGSTLVLAVKGQTFSADMSVTLKRCQKFIKIVPKGIDISLMSLNFRKQC
ncbi:MAG: hypothetical protein AAF228_13225 [Pseudomonadota bacterium]